MHVRQSIELAALITAQGQVFAASGQELTAASTREYWSASVKRLNAWCRVLEQHASRIKSLRGRHARRMWQSTLPVMEEILIGEILARVWAAVCCGPVLSKGGGDAGLAVRKILAGHLQVRHRALCLMVHGQGLRIEVAVNLNRLRRQNEYWTDVLLASMAETCSAEEFSFDRGRFRELTQQMSQGTPLSQRFLLASMRAAYHSGLANSSPSRELNRQIAAAIISCFPAEAFDSTGLLKSLQLIRLARPCLEQPGPPNELQPGGVKYLSSDLPAGRLWTR